MKCLLFLHDLKDHVIRWIIFTRFIIRR